MYAVVSIAASPVVEVVSIVMLGVLGGSAASAVPARANAKTAAAKNASRHLARFMVFDIPLSFLFSWSVYVAFRRNYSGKGLLYRLQVTFLNDKTEPFKRPNAEHELPDNLLFGDATDCFVA